MIPKAFRRGRPDPTTLRSGAILSLGITLALVLTGVAVVVVVGVIK